jgi:hypothetical protein
VQIRARDDCRDLCICELRLPKPAIYAHGPAEVPRNGFEEANDIPPVSWRPSFQISLKLATKNVAGGKPRPATNCCTSASPKRPGTVI